MTDRLQQALEIIKEELTNCNARKYVNINNFGYSQVERNIAERILALGNSFTLEEIRVYLESQDSFGDIFYNLSEENIVKANEEKKELEQSEERRTFNQLMCSALSTYDEHYELGGEA